MKIFLGAGNRRETDPEKLRVPVPQILEIVIEDFVGFIEKFASNISKGGVFVGTDRNLPPGTPLEILFRLEDNYTLIRGRGTVVWVRAAADATRPAGMGVRFDWLDEESQKLINKIVSNYIKEGGKPFRLEDSAPSPDAGGQARVPAGSGGIAVGAASTSRAPASPAATLSPGAPHEGVDSVRAGAGFAPGMQRAPAVTTPTEGLGGPPTPNAVSSLGTVATQRPSPLPPPGAAPSARPAAPPPLGVQHPSGVLPPRPRSPAAPPAAPGPAPARPVSPRQASPPPAPPRQAPPGPAPPRQEPPRSAQVPLAPRSPAPPLMPQVPAPPTAHAPGGGFFEEADLGSGLGSFDLSLDGLDGIELPHDSDELAVAETDPYDTSSFDQEQKRTGGRAAASGYPPGLHLEPTAPISLPGFEAANPADTGDFSDLSLHDQVEDIEYSIGSGAGARAPRAGSTRGGDRRAASASPGLPVEGDEPAMWGDMHVGQVTDRLPALEKTLAAPEHPVTPRPVAFDPQLDGGRYQTMRREITPRPQSVGRFVGLGDDLRRYGMSALSLLFIVLLGGGLYLLGGQILARVEQSLIHSAAEEVALADGNEVLAAEAPTLLRLLSDEVQGPAILKRGQAPPAALTVIENITWIDSDDETVITLWGDGAFTTSNTGWARIGDRRKPRELIKVFGVSEAYGPTELVVDTEHVSRLRLGFHVTPRQNEQLLVADLASPRSVLKSFELDGDTLHLHFGR